MVERCVRDAEVASSNLVASTHFRFYLKEWPHGQAVERRPLGVNSGSIPDEVICFGFLSKAFLLDASVAQLVAQRIRNAWVAGSSPARASISKENLPKKQGTSKGFRLDGGVFITWMIKNRVNSKRNIVTTYKFVHYHCYFFGKVCFKHTKHRSIKL